MKPFRLAAIVRPQRIRSDSEGHGAFGARRDGGARTHAGLDLLVKPGDPIYSPVHGRFIRSGWPYANSAMRMIVIQGEGYEIKIMYAKPLPELQPGQRVIRGQRIGTAQAVSTHYQRSAMRDHVHVEVRRVVGADLLDPATLLQLD
ncbi:MAG: M23 family metallopeptidase [Burkholderiaceae bacterium]|nr:M23 family metallopeptidase [Burkholderiaceae bacterium]